LDDREVGKMWDANADAWTKLARMGYDVYRDHLNTPAFMKMLPDVSGMRGLDIGCGEGHNTRLVARRGAAMTAVDIAPKFVRHAADMEAEEPLGIRYAAASGGALPFPDECFDFALAFMSLMDMACHEAAVGEAHRVLKPGGFLQFSIIHPCFWTPRWEWIRNETGQKVAVACGDYFEERWGTVEEWIFGAAPQELREKLPKFRVPRFFRRLSSWMNLLAEAGFRLEQMQEPCADEETAKRCPDVADTRILPLFLHARYRK
jgi:ubiquinone/menaquinone biosynthesis C-methylase UbiE